MDRELLIEIGVEELPASWMPGLTRQLAERLEARLKEFRIAPGAPIESFSTPRRLTARVRASPNARTISTRRSPARRCRPRSARTASHRPAALGFARKQGVAFEQLTRAKARRRASTSRIQKHERGRSAVDTLPDVLGGLLRDLAVPEADALGRAARRRPGRAAVRPSDPLAAVPLRRPRRAVHDRPFRRCRQVARCRTSSRVR